MNYEKISNIEPKRYKEYLIGKIKKAYNTNALFFNQLDLVDRSKDEEFLIRGEKILEQFQEEDNVRYYFNSLGYRSDEFINSHDGEHILFAGCSETEGMGGNLDSNWAYMVYSELAKKNKLSGFFNLSRGGWGHQIIIPNIIQYIHRYGKPDKIYLLLPNISRKYEWQGNDKNKELYVHKIRSPYWSNEPEVKDWFGEPRLKQTLEEQRDDLVDFIILLKMFEEYCISNNIGLVWSTWSEPDAQNYKQLKVFKRFITIPYKPEVILKSKSFVVDKDKEKIKFRKRDWHHGYLYHYMWAEKFLSVFDKK